ncbi:SDR family NAD(P)-dependent oxidoreductase, partial [Paenibacillus sp. AR247]|uniref:SDR family NAD(P)-dependent oxidoreductase n=1 Tax=Paenibacillus sp. AR247 TaxID=1631599 RepID=UPI001C61210F
MTVQTSDHKIALVTGGSRGLGRNTILQLAKRGVDSIFTYHTNETEAQQVVQSVRDLGQEAVALQLNTADTSSFDGFAQNVRQVLAELGAKRFDYLVNNAGTSHHNSIEQTTEEELDQLYNVHFKGVFFPDAKAAS